MFGAPAPAELVCLHTTLHQRCRADIQAVALEITNEAVKVWSWLPGSIPADVLAGTPKPGSSWGLPELLITNDHCDTCPSHDDGVPCHSLLQPALKLLLDRFRNSQSALSTPQ